MPLVQAALEVAPAIALPRAVDEDEVFRALQGIRFGCFGDGADLEAPAPWMESNRSIAASLVSRYGSLATIDGVLHVGAKHESEVSLAGVLLVVQAAAAASKDDPALTARLIQLFRTADTIGRQAVATDGKIIDAEAGSSRAKHLQVAIVESLSGTSDASARALLNEALRSPKRLVRGAAASALNQ